MPLPLNDCVDDIPTDVCCPTLFGIADRIRCIATEALMPCLDPNLCTELGFRSIVAMNPHDDFFGDILTVSLTSWSVDSSSQTANNTLPVLLTVAEYMLELTETGWPVPEVNEQNEIINVPPADMTNALSRHVYSHGEVVYRALLDVAARKQFWRESIGLPTDRFSAFQLGNVTPLPPAGRLVGWRIPMRVRWNPGPGARGS